MLEWVVRIKSATAVAEASVIQLNLMPRSLVA